MEFSDVVRARRMVRRYDARPVEPAALDRILDTARRGPSAGFSQGVHFVVLDEPGDRVRMAEICDEPAHVVRGFDPWLSRAPVHIVPCVHRGDYDARYAAADKARSIPPPRWSVPFWWVDAGAALTLLLLATVDEGLAAGLLAIEDVPAVRTLLDLPEQVAPVGVVTVGHPAPDRPSGSLARGRRPLAEVVHRGRWGL